MKRALSPSTLCRGPRWLLAKSVRIEGIGTVRLLPAPRLCRGCYACAGEPGRSLWICRGVSVSGIGGERPQHDCVFRRMTRGSVGPLVAHGARRSTLMRLQWADVQSGRSACPCVQYCVPCRRQLRTCVNCERDLVGVSPSRTLHVRLRGFLCVCV